MIDVLDILRYHILRARLIEINAQLEADNAWLTWLERVDD